MKKELLIVSLAVVMSTTLNVSAAYNKFNVDEVTSSMIPDMREFISAYDSGTKITKCKYIHGYAFTRNELTLDWDAVKGAKSYTVKLSKDQNFKEAKTYKVKTNYLYSSNYKNDKMFDPEDHAKYVKIRANFNKVHGNYSKPAKIGCDKLHLKK